VKDFYWIEETTLTHQRDTSVYKTKNKVIRSSFHIEHIINLVTSVKKGAKQEDEATIRLKVKSINLIRIVVSDR
jgi:hypothetical protein